jgi:hypothetical protein
MDLGQLCLDSSETDLCICVPYCLSDVRPAQFPHRAGLRRATHPVVAN